MSTAVGTQTPQPVVLDTGANASFATADGMDHFIQFAEET
jgi:hypothetical protein